MSFETVFENSHIVVADKPHGWLSTPSREASDPRPCLGRELQARMGRQIFPVHRLDFEVSGLLMFALTKEAHRETQKWFEESVVRKTYQAFSASGPENYGDWAEWYSQLARGKRRAFEAGHGKKSITRARVVRRLPESEGGFCLWELMPLTGRSHQLRFEMAKHHFPILGDELYGGAAIYGGAALTLKNWIGLRAVELDFTVIPDAGRFGLPQILRVPDLRPPDIRSR